MPLRDRIRIPLTRRILMEDGLTIAMLRNNGMYVYYIRRLQMSVRVQVIIEEGGGGKVQITGP